MAGKPIMAICDSQAAYTSRLISMFQEKKELPFEIHGFTKQESLQEFCGKNRIALLIISEPDYREELEKNAIDQILVLQEGVRNLPENVVTVRKFQPAGMLYREIMRVYGESEKIVPFQGSKKDEIQLIGVYSPLHCCMQTTFALTAGQLLAKKKKTLYLNFECFSGFETLLGKRFDGNMTDILYYYECAKEKLSYKLEAIVQEMGDLYFIPPAGSYEDFRDIQEEEWACIITEIAKAGGYDVILLDLTEHVRGIYSILESCDKIYTLIKDDRMAKAKLAQYELMLEKENYRKISEKTEKCRLPLIKNLPPGLGHLNHGELADYVEKLMKEDGLL
ncbi:MAG: hypothetical protein HDQ96_07915 [Lachnospiraceae bacterium]|nr:hypothetical protein [Lachnospiraceae bacterium]